MGTAAGHLARLHRGPAVLSLLRSPRLVLGALAFAAAYSGAAAWAPWSLAGDGSPPPAWAEALGLDHPFTAAPFLLCVALVFSSTLACTWGRRRRIAGLLAGELPPSAVALAPCGADARAFLEARGFRGRGEVLRRNGWALWGGWVLHVGLLVLLAAVLVQQALQDGGAFELAEGEVAHLSEPGVVIGHERGSLAPRRPPDVEVWLERFDPSLHQDGYAPDRLSRIGVARPGGPRRSAAVDRAAGARFGPVEIFQAIPTGLSLTLEIQGMGTRSVHLWPESERVASARLADPAGLPARLVVTAERSLDDRLGTGPLRVEVEQGGLRAAVAPRAPFPFGGRQARLVSVGRWARFTYARAPGMAGVVAGFAVVLLGCALLVVPAGVARLGAPGTGPAATVFQPRGRALLLAEWRRDGGAR